MQDAAGGSNDGGISSADSAAGNPASSARDAGSQSHTGTGGNATPRAGNAGEARNAVPKASGARTDTGDLNRNAARTNIPGDGQTRNDSALGAESPVVTSSANAATSGGVGAPSRSIPASNAISLPEIRDLAQRVSNARTKADSLRSEDAIAAQDSAESAFERAVRTAPLNVLLNLAQTINN